MKKLSTLILLCAAAAGASAQGFKTLSGKSLNITPDKISSISVYKDYDFRPVYLTRNISKGDTVDMAEITVVYDLTFVDDARNPERTETERMELLAGGRFACFRSWRGFAADSLQWLQSRKIEPDMELEGKFTQPYCIYTDLAARTLRVVERLPHKSTGEILYEEEQPQFDWQIGERIDTVAGYPCRTATTRYGGRDWTVWFTEEIPLGVGPYKFSGLPGLILKAADSQGHFTFECCGMNQSSRAICFYDWKYRKMSKKEYVKFIRSLYDSPYDHLTDGGTALYIISDKTTGQPVVLDEEWKLICNPIELE